MNIWYHSVSNNNYGKFIIYKEIDKYITSKKKLKLLLKNCDYINNKSKIKHKKNLRQENDIKTKEISMKLRNTLPPFINNKRTSNTNNGKDNMSYSTVSFNDIQKKKKNKVHRVF